MGIDNELDVVEKQKIEIFEPNTKKVYIINDNYSTFGFVVLVLTTVFNKTEEEANQITVNVHEQGECCVGEYLDDIALTKVEQVFKLGNQYKFPLRAEAR